MNLQYQEISIWRQHAMAEFPKESCGYINVHGEYIACRNSALNPENDYVIDTKASPDEIIAYCHSHTDVNNSGPSRADMESEMRTGIPHGIIATDGKACTVPVFFGDRMPRKRLLGRQYIHGVTDCYSVCRDYYSMVHGIKLPEFPRNKEFWKDGLNFYEDNLAKVGFEEISKFSVLPGDGLLFKLGSRVYNHAAVVLPDDVILHHPQDKLSRRGNLSEWLQYAIIGVRWSKENLSQSIEKLKWALEVGE